MVAPELDRSVWGHLVGRGSSEPPKCRTFSMTQCGFRVPRFSSPVRIPRMPVLVLNFSDSKANLIIPRLNLIIPSLLAASLQYIIYANQNQHVPQCLLF